MNEKRSYSLTHPMMVWDIHFDELKRGTKRFVTGLRDRDFHVGDVLQLRRTIPIQKTKQRNADVDMILDPSSHDLFMTITGLEVSAGDDGISEAIVIMSVQPEASVTESHWKTRLALTAIVALFMGIFIGMAWRSSQYEYREELSGSTPVVEAPNYDGHRDDGGSK